jgi:hypothetical protein
MDLKVLNIQADHVNRQPFYKPPGSRTSLHHTSSTRMTPFPHPTSKMLQSFRTDVLLSNHSTSFFNVCSPNLNQLEKFVTQKMNNI